MCGVYGNSVDPTGGTAGPRNSRGSDGCVLRIISPTLIWSAISNEDDDALLHIAHPRPTLRTPAVYREVTASIREVGAYCTQQAGTHNQTRGCEACPGWGK